MSGKFVGRSLQADRLTVTADSHLARANRARQLIDSLVGRHGGIVRDLQIVPTPRSEPRLFHVAARIANAQAPLAGGNRVWNGGTGVNLAAAVLAAIGEAVERYAASGYDVSDLPTVSRLSADDELLNVTTSHLQFSPSATGESRSPQTVGDPIGCDPTWGAVHAVAGLDLQSGATIFVPAFAVYLPYAMPEDLPFRTVGLSSGLACHDSLASATLRGILELIERDAISLVWEKGITPCRLPEEWLRGWAGEMFADGDEVWAFDLTSNLFVAGSASGHEAAPRIPVAMVVSRSRDADGTRRVAAGSACRLSLSDAVRDAACECAQSRLMIGRLLRPNRESKETVDLRDFRSHARYYSDHPDQFEAGFEFLLSAEPTRLPSEPSLGPEISVAGTPGRLAWLVDSLSSWLGPIVRVDLTQPWMRPLGLSVVRVVIPGLFPLHADRAYLPRQHPRWKLAVSALDVGEVRHRFGEWPYPHPFA